MRIVDSLGEGAKEIRPIEFRRGLNIIATAVHPGDKTVPTVGHSVGKSLLLRLIRYCLGETGYAERAVRQAICGFLPHGYVVAEFVVEGKSWHVARPIGLDSAASASWSTLDDGSLLLDESSRQSFEVFHQMLNTSLIARLPQIRLPKAQRPISWNDLLGWLSPDQECAHKSHAEWRPGGTDPSNHGLKIEDNHIVIRSVMDLLTARDSGLITHHKELLRRQGKLGRRIDHARAVLNARRADLVASADWDVDGLDGAILATHVEQYARRQREALERLLDEELADDPVQRWREQHDDLQRRIGAKMSELEEEKNDLETAELQLQAIFNDDELEQNAQLGEWCHLFLTRDQAMLRGCPGEVEHVPGAVDPGRERRIRELTETIERCKKRIEGLTSELEALAKDSKDSQQKLNDARREAAGRRQPLRDRIEHYRGVESLAERYGAEDRQLQQHKDQQRSLRDEIGQSLETRREADRRYRENRQSLGDQFRFALSGLLGQELDGSIEINANGIFPRPSPAARARGTALRKSTVLAFDLACLAASIAGLGYHPRFMLHDSPRDADMEEPLYHRLFEVVSELEGIFDKHEPSFQFIVTTTSPPPKELDTDEFVRLRLDARTDEGHLLRRAF